MLTAPVDYNALLQRNAVDDRSGDERLKLEGKIAQIRYSAPQGRSSLEVVRNYESALRAKGFATLFSCADKACLSGVLRDPYLIGQLVDPLNGNTGLYLDHARYLLTELDQGSGPGSAGPTYAAVLVGEEGPQVTAFVEVVETKAMEEDKITVVDAAQMAKSLDTAHSVNVYGLLFDFDSATLKSESKPTLDEIAKLLTNQPDLRLKIVGHTDNQGSPDYNMALSERRAQSVVDALTAQYSIDARRLSASGAGLTMPIAPNDIEEGRAKNRRVELVTQ